MEVAESNLIPQILLTLATIGYGFITMKADFNATHATNPLWTGHARFHVVWQILSYSGIAIIALGLIWSPGPMASERLYLTSALAFVIYGSFFIATVARPVFEGKLYDENGYTPFKPPLGLPGWRWDVNVTAFTILSFLLVAGTLAI
jgi:hypothetical protein